MGSNPPPASRFDPGELTFLKQVAPHFYIIIFLPGRFAGHTSGPRPGWLGRARLLARAHSPLPGSMGWASRIGDRQWSAAFDTSNGIQDQFGRVGESAVELLGSQTDFYCTRCNLTQTGETINGMIPLQSVNSPL